jgi:hypothetical protein
MILPNKEMPFPALPADTLIRCIFHGGQGYRRSWVRAALIFLCILAAQLRVLFNLLEFFLGQDGGFADDAFAHEYLPDVVKDRADAQTRERLAAEPYGDAGHDGEDRDVDGVEIRIIVKAFQVDHIDHHAFVCQKLVDNAFDLPLDVRRSLPDVPAALDIVEDFSDAVHGFDSQIFADGADDIDIAGQIVVNIQAENIIL